MFNFFYCFKIFTEAIGWELSPIWSWSSCTPARSGCKKCTSEWVWRTAELGLATSVASGVPVRGLAACTSGKAHRPHNFLTFYVWTEFSTCFSCQQQGVSMAIYAVLHLKENVLKICALHSFWFGTLHFVHVVFQIFSSLMTIVWFYDVLPGGK